MAGVVQDDWIKTSLGDNVSGALVGVKVHLFSNNVTPTNADSLATYTEANFTGYAAATASGWSAAGLTGHVASTTANPVTFTLTAGSQNVYGYYLTDSTSGKLYAAERDPNAPVALNTTASTYQITPKIERQSA